jgi:hypothetical protein
LDRLSREYRAIQRKARKQPGLVELLKVYGEYESVAKVAATYLDATTPAPVVVNSNSSLE